MWNLPCQISQGNKIVEVASLAVRKGIVVSNALQQQLGIELSQEIAGRARAYGALIQPVAAISWAFAGPHSAFGHTVIFVTVSFEPIFCAWRVTNVEWIPGTCPVDTCNKGKAVLQSHFPRSS